MRTGLTDRDIAALRAHAKRERAKREAAEGKAALGGGVHRGTSNRNERGGSDARRRRRQWLVTTYRANVDRLTAQEAARQWAEEYSPDPYHGGWISRDGLTSWTGSPPPFDRITSYGAAGTGQPCCRCYRCGTLMTEDEVTVDRIIPGALGGTYARTNIRPACGPCNSETGATVRRKPGKGTRTT